MKALCMSDNPETGAGDTNVTYASWFWYQCEASMQSSIKNKTKNLDRVLR